MAPVLLGSWHMDEGSWNSTAGEVIDSSGKGNHGRARIANGSTPPSSTTSGSAAFSTGAQSTCRYGAFDGTGSPSRAYSYVELSGFPTLPNGFTFAAWIRSTNAGAQHQRILVRDDADNGWGLSLADGTGSPELRFFNRNVTNSGAVTGQGTNPNCGVFCVDTNPIIASNTWYYVAAAVDTSVQTVTLYVYSQAGALQAKAVGAYAGTWKDGTGTAAIGGETAASSEGQQPSFHFLGNIDEVNIYSGALSQTGIEALLPSVRTCPAPDHYELQVAATNVACAGADVTVRACADSAVPCNQDNSVSTNVTLGTTAGTLNATSLALVSGTATTRLRYGNAVDGALATVSLSGEVTTATNSRKCCTGTSSCSVANSCTTTFKTSGFVFPGTLSGISDTLP
ncbi:MAG: LamG domain-containing protein, partial [Sphingobacteriales bacterium]